MVASLGVVIAAIVTPLSLVAPSANAGLFDFIETSSQTLIPRIAPGQSGLVVMRLSNLFLEAKVASKIVWTAPPGTTILDLPTCYTSYNIKTIAADGRTAACTGITSGLTPNVLPYQNTAMIKVGATTPVGTNAKGPRGGDLRLDQTSGSAHYAFLVVVV